MKHNTHIYLATKAIEFLYEGLGNLSCRTTNKKAAPAAISKKRQEGKVLQRMLMHYQDAISEAAWAPDDILNDKSQYHTFKLFTDQEFPDSSRSDVPKETHRDKYYRLIGSGSGGLAYKVDHLARVIADMDKLRKYNDRCSMNQIMYQYLMLSHYIVDAHVPMHCDLRDDPPSADDKIKPRNGVYYPEALHGEIEQLWEDAVIPVAIKEDIIKPDRKDYDKSAPKLSQQVQFNVMDDAHCDAIKPYLVPNDDLMGYMVDLCIQSKDRALNLFPIGTPAKWDQDNFFKMTRDIFADAIGNLITVWIWIWSEKQGSAQASSSPD
jgi:hypothetical protein